MDRLIPFIFLFPFALLFAQETILFDKAEEISHFYTQEIAKTPPPLSAPQADACLAQASVWFRVDVDKMSPGLDAFTSEESWRLLRDLGVSALYFSPGQEAYPLWTAIEMEASKRQMTLIGDITGNAPSPNADFERALQAQGNYPSLYQLIEVDPSDWKLLPPLSQGTANVPWLSLQELHRKGYVPEKFNPYIKESSWNATAKITGVDGKARRWIYLKEGENRPVLDWLSPTFCAYRLAAGDALQHSFEKGEEILRLDGAIPPMTQEMLSLWIRKIGSFSVATAQGTLEELRRASTDLIFDAATPSPFLHALIAQDAEALRIIYRLFLEEGIASKRLVHTLEPFDKNPCDWVALLDQPQKKFRYREESITGEVLRRRLLKEDLIRLNLPDEDRLYPKTWVDGCARALNIKDFEKHKEEITRAHLLIAFAYAMQPGAFSFSLSDLLGALPHQKAPLDFLEASGPTLYSSLPVQLKNPRSFASQLKAILHARAESTIAQGELIDVPQTAHAATLLLVHRLPQTRFVQVLALNFGKSAVQESIELPSLRQTSAIDLMSGLSEEKIFSSSRFSFIIPPLAGRAFYFQPKYYD